MSIFIPGDDATHRVVYAFGLLLLGAVTLAFRDFALQWQPVPAMLPHRALFASLNASLLLGCSVMLLTDRYRVAAWIASGYLLLWVVSLHGPRLAAQPADVSAWLGAAEIVTLGLGSAALVTDSSTARRVLRYAFAMCVGIFGSSHFVYPQFTASLVPTRLPAPLFWAYATGAAHLAASASLLTGVMLRTSMRMLTTMLALITLSVQVPRVIAEPSHANWVALAISVALTGVAWLLSMVLRVDERAAAHRTALSNDVIPS